MLYIFFCLFVFYLYIQIYTREENIKIETVCLSIRSVRISDAWSMADGVRLLQSRSSAEDGDIKRTSAIQDNGRNENQRPKVAVVPSSATQPCRFALLRRGRVSRNSCVDERGRRFSIIAVELTGEIERKFRIEMRKRVPARFQRDCARMFRDRYQMKETISLLRAK